MASFVTEAIVLSTMRYGEADRILSLLTENLGRIGAIAKSARKSTSSFHAAAEPYVYGRYELAEGKSLNILRSAEIINPHLGIRASWSRVQLAGHVCEIATKLGEEKHPDPELYHLTMDALDALDAGRQDAVIRFKAALLDYIGVFPELGGCVQCGSTKAKGQVHLDDPAGGFLCGECAKSRGVYHPVPMPVLHLLHGLQNGEGAGDDVKAEILDQADDLLTALLQAFLQAGFKTVPAERQARVAERERVSLKENPETNDEIPPGSQSGSC